MKINVLDATNMFYLNMSDNCHFTWTYCKLSTLIFVKFVLNIVYYCLPLNERLLWIMFNNWPIDSPPKMASWRTSFVGPSIVFTCQSCLCKSLSPSPSPIIGQSYYNGAIWLSYCYKYSGKRCVNHEDQDRRGGAVDRSISFFCHMMLLCIQTT